MNNRSTNYVYILAYYSIEKTSPMGLYTKNNHAGERQQ
jgi:hypothetical protein